MLKITTAQDRRNSGVSKELEHHKKVVAPLAFREQRWALKFPRKTYHINPVQERIAREQKRLHPMYRHLARLGLG